MIKFSVLLILAISVLFGCDSFHNFSRTIRLDSSVEHECIKIALGNVEQVKNVKYELRSGGRPLTLTGIQDSDIHHYYYYEIEDLYGHIILTKDYKNTSEIIQGYPTYNLKNNQATINKINYVIEEIQNSVEKECEIKGNWKQFYSFPE